MFRTILVSTAAVLTLAAPAVAADTPKVTAVSLEKASDGQVAIFFRTDGAAPRKPGGGIKGSAGLKSAQEASIGTFRAGKHCYVAYTKARGLKLGAQSKVHVALAGHETTKTLTLKADANGRSIGC
jgi:hypothetical protein